jgi:S-sulfo-L-cysteine synthase (3-phospho-L-serine-dependent)
MAAPAPAVILIARQENADELPFIHERGLASVMFGTRISLRDALTATASFELDLNDHAQVLEKVDELRGRFDFRAVFTMNEYRLVLAARIAEALGISHALSSATAATCRSKISVRELLRKRNLNNVRYAKVTSVEEALAAASDLSLPVVVKPSNDAGSNLVTRCDTPEEVRAAVEAIKGAKVNWVSQRLEDHVLIEEYLDGPEFSVESASDSERTEVIMITAKATHDMIELGHMVPAPLPADDADAIRSLVKSSLEALGVRNTVTHTEVKLTRDGPKIVEVNARVGGDRIHKIVEAVTGINLMEWSLHLALGGRLEDAPRRPPKTATAISGFILARHDGVVSYRDPAGLGSVPGLQDLQMTVANGSRVRQTTSNYDRIGHYILHLDHGTRVEAEERRIVELLDLRIAAERAAA